MNTVRIACAGALVTLLACTSGASAWVVPDSAPRVPRCPAIPDAKDVDLNAEELARIEAGEIVVRLADFGDLGRRVWAAGYLDANPVWLFDVATDSRLASALVDIVQRVEVTERREDGKVMSAVADPSVLLPEFGYTLAVSYLADGTGQCWAQIEGDFKTNEGSHSYLWDPARGRTLAVMSFDVSLKGLLSIVPDELVRKLSARTLPEYMRRLEKFAEQFEAEDQPRAERVERRWKVLRARLEKNELTGRVWLGANAQSADATSSFGVASDAR